MTGDRAEPLTARRRPASMLAPGAPWLESDVAHRMARWGFLVHPDLPDGPGPAFLLVALRASPTDDHFDPESVEFWVTEQGKGERRTLTYASPMPRSEPYAWGTIRLADRFGVTNEYLSFGGRLDAALVDGVVLAAFTSPAPLLRRGGHSQPWDAGADAIAAFFGRLRIAVDVEPEFQAALDDAGPMARYAPSSGTDRAPPAGRAEGLEARQGPAAAAHGGHRLRAEPPTPGTPPAPSLPGRSRADGSSTPRALAPPLTVRCTST